MYSTCLFCTGPLGTNEAIEHFPVGRRLAFDASRGRLWVVCPRCARWNLTPLEERWEAVEECERAFRASRLRVSTDNVGLCRLREGTELVRVGAPLRPEMAAWRYGDQFGRRRRETLVRYGLGGLAIGALVIGGVATGAITGGSVAMGLMGRNWAERLAAKRRVARLMVDGQPVAMEQQQLSRVRFGLLHGWHEPVLQLSHSHGTARFRGADAAIVLGRLLPQVNRMGATRVQLGDAVAELDGSDGADAYLGDAAQRAARLGITTLVDYPYEVRLALEMAAHEDGERRALAGELAALEDAWKSAEELAAIADDMFVPGAVTRRLGEMKAKGGGDAT